MLEENKSMGTDRLVFRIYLLFLPLADTTPAEPLYISTQSCCKSRRSRTRQAPTADKFGLGTAQRS